jgi:galactokinase
VTPAREPGAKRAVRLYQQSFATPLGGVWSAPGRVNLIGEHTDYNEGYVLPMAIDYRTYVAAGRSTTPTIEVVSEAMAERVEVAIDAIDPDRISGWSGYVLGVIWAIRESGIDIATKPGLTLAIASDVPLGAGLSSSAALECSVALALNDLWDLGLAGGELAAIGQRAENDVVGANTGMMDQMVSMLATHGHAVFLDCRSGSVAHVPLLLGDFGIVVMDTKVSHQLAESQYGARRASCEKAAEFFGATALRDVTPEAIESATGALDEVTRMRARHIVTENARVLAALEALGKGNLGGFGVLVNQSHESMRDDFEISSPELDLAVSVAQGVGALGARMTGGGFGGSAIAVIHRDLLDTLSTTLHSEFSQKGWSVPTPVWVTASAGARREEIEKEQS